MSFINKKSEILLDLLFHPIFSRQLLNPVENWQHLAHKAYLAYLTDLANLANQLANLDQSNSTDLKTYRNCDFQRQTLGLRMFFAR